MSYLVETFLIERDAPGAQAQAQQITSTPRNAVNDALSEWRLPRLHSWRYVGSTGSNAPQHRGTLNSSHYELRDRPGVVLVVTLYELVPRDPQTEL